MLQSRLGLLNRPETLLSQAFVKLVNSRRPSIAGRTDPRRNRPCVLHMHCYDRGIDQ